MTEGISKKLNSLVGRLLYYAVQCIRLGHVLHRFYEVVERQPFSRPLRKQNGGPRQKDEKEDLETL